MSIQALEPTWHFIQWAPEILSLGVKRPRCESDHSLVPRWKNAWSYTATPPIRLHSMVLIKKAQGQLYLLPLPTCEANDRSAGQEIPRVYITGSFITVFTTAPRWTLSWLQSHEMDNCNSNAGSGKRFSPRCPDLLWVPPSLFSNGYLGLLPWE